MSARSITIVLAASLALLALFALSPFSSPDAPLSEKEALAKVLAEHPYANRAPMSKKELKAIPKADRPDLAIEQHFLRTMDPATETRPVERLFEANQIAVDYKRSIGRSGGPVVTEEWVERGPTNVGGRTRAIMFDPNDEDNLKVWAGGVGGGLWFTEDITDSDGEWSNVNDFWSNIAISAIAYDPTDTQVFYASTGEGWFNADAIQGGGIFKSEDGGETWNLLEATTPAFFQYIQDLVVDPATGDVYASTRDAGLRRSQDGGETWSAVINSSVGAASNRAADIEIAADGTFYVTFGIFNQDGIYKSSTGNLDEWERISDNPGFATGGYNRIELATAPSDADVLYAVTHQSGSNGIQDVFRSGDAGATWTELTFPTHPTIGNPARNQAWYDLIIQVAPEDEDIIYLGSIDFQRSSDGGDSWELITGGAGNPAMHVDMHNMIFRPGSATEAIFSNDGGIYYTADATAETIPLTNRNDAYNVTQFYSAALNPLDGSDLMLGGTQDNGTRRFFQEGVGASALALGGDGGFTFIDQDEPALAIASTQFLNYFRSTNGGISFTTPILQASGGQFINPADYDNREDILYAASAPGGFYRVTNVLTTADQSTVSIVLGGTATHFSVSPFAPEGTSTVYIGTSSGRIFRVANAQDDADIEEIASGPIFGAVSSIEFGVDEDQMLVTVSNFGVNSVFETMDGGDSWSNKEGDLPDIPVLWALYNPTDRTKVILATEAGIWETRNIAGGRVSWTAAPGFPTTRVDMLQIRESDDLMVMAATHGRGVFTAPMRNFINDIEQAVPSGEAYTLDAAYPNPFADRATVGLRVAQAQDVRVEVFNTVGQRVAVLHDGALAAATPHRFTLEGQDLASGTYIYVVTGETFRDEGRMTLVR